MCAAHVPPLHLARTCWRQPRPMRALDSAASEAAAAAAAIRAGQAVQQALWAYPWASWVCSPCRNVHVRPHARTHVRPHTCAQEKLYALNPDKIQRGEDRRTTLMIKNIPNKYTQKMLLAAVDEQFKGTYDFFYLPIDFKNKCNVGYAFINMVQVCVSLCVRACLQSAH